MPQGSELNKGNMLCLEIFACVSAAAKRMELLNASPKTFPTKGCEGMRHFFFYYLFPALSES